uniref:Ant protein n=1 Tax=Nephromyces sp. MMRI TaxID=2496275 RepID=A0A3S8V2X0_9APIC|nr:Ant protein [Nephromyces sp. MMRI]
MHNASLPAEMRDSRISDIANCGLQYTFFQNMVSSIITSSICTALVHPLWLIKTRFELQSYESKIAGWTQYKSWCDCLRKVIRDEGYTALYKGIRPAMALAPHAAIQMIIYEELRRYHLTNSSIQPFLSGVISKFGASSLTYPLQILRSRQQMLYSESPNESILRAASVSNIINKIV